MTGTIFLGGTARRQIHLAKGNESVQQAGLGARAWGRVPGAWGPGLQGRARPLFHQFVAVLKSLLEGSGHDTPPYPCV